MMVAASRLKPDEVEKAYDFFRKGKFFEPTGKVSRKRAQPRWSTRCASLGDIPRIEVERLLLPGVTQMAD